MSGYIRVSHGRHVTERWIKHPVEFLSAEEFTAWAGRAFKPGCVVELYGSTVLASATVPGRIGEEGE